LIFLAYLALSLLLFGREAITDPNTICACSGDGDPTSFMWSFEWMPHSLFNGLDWHDPKIIWAPEGANLTQGGFGIPAATIALMPVTLIAGPVVAYNVASVLMPVLAAWFAYRLCRYLTGATGPAFVGGLVFGFGTYMSAHLLGHLNLTSVFLAPAAVLLVLQRLDDVISQRRFVVLMAVVLGLQLLLSAEMLLIGLLVGALALLLAYAFGDADRRARLARVVLPILGAGGIAIVVTSPYLYWVLDGLGDADSEAWRTFTELYPGDALNPIVPTEVTGLGHWWFEDMSAKFTNFTPAEAAAYVGVVLLGIVVAFAITQWRRPAARVIVGVILVCYVLSLGTELHVGGDDTGVWMPWSLLHPLPVLDHVISTRFWAYALLAIAIAVALWLATPSTRQGVKWAVAVVGLALLVPNLSSDFWSGRPTNPSFFTSDEYEQHLREGERVLALPYARYGSSMLWQADTGMYFDMVEGYVSPEFPPGFRHDPYFPKLLSAQVSGQEDVDGLRDFLRRRQVTAVVVEQKGAGPWPIVLGAMGLKPVRTGGVLFYRVGA
jgi:hypothetical protein